MLNLQIEQINWKNVLLYIMDILFTENNKRGGKEGGWEVRKEERKEIQGGSEAKSGTKTVTILLCVLK